MIKVSANNAQPTGASRGGMLMWGYIVVPNINVTSLKVSKLDTCACAPAFRFQYDCRAAETGSYFPLLAIYLLVSFIVSKSHVNLPILFVVRTHTYHCSTHRAFNYLFF